MTTTRSIHAARAVGRNDYVRSDSEYVRSSCPHLAAHRCPIFDVAFEGILNAIPAIPAALETIQDGVTATLRGIGLYNIGDLLGARNHLAPLLPFLASSPLVLAPEDSCSQHMLERMLAGHVTCARAVRNRCTPFDITDSSLLSTIPSHEQRVASRNGVVNFLIAAAITIRFGMELDAAAYVAGALEFIEREIAETEPAPAKLLAPAVAPAVCHA
jgi:hypothetical protein